MTQLPPASFPVVFFDGDRDIDVGSVAVTPAFDFNKFQSMVAEKIGAPPQRISISLVRRKKARYSPEIQRKVPIDESSDFLAISRERDCFVLVVMKRSRSGRRGRGRRGRGAAAAAGGDENAAIEVREMTILKRNLGFWDYEAQIWNLHRMRESYLLYAPPPAFPPAPATPPVCEECVEAKRDGRSPGFHSCVHDRITFGFRSPAGPIERPKKMNMNASA